MNRIAQEKQVITTMIQLYCRRKHKQKGGLCTECQALDDYAQKRLNHCRHGENKTFCAHCPTQCYHPNYKAQMKEVMKFSGPRMLLHHPVLALRHMLHK